MTHDPSFDVVIVGAGIVGAACAYHATRAGLSVCVVDRGSPAAGTTSAGEGNLLVSDKEPGPELDLALLSNTVWRATAGVPVRGTTFGAGAELDPKGGLVVASSAATLSSLAELARRQAAAGVEAEPVAADGLHDHEPNLAGDLAGGFRYPQDMQVQPMLATALLLRLARDAGAVLLFGEAVTGFARDGDRVTGVRTSRRALAAGAVVNCAGTWAGEVAALAGVHVPVAPRRGFVLVTEPLPRVVRHKVYFADYVSDVASDSAALQASPVVEGTPSGTVLIGATRERVGFDRTWSPDAIRTLAAGAVRLFPFLADVVALRAYRGFRPYCPDHLPIIGPDRRAPGLWHACGHEGAGIGLSAATGHLIAQGLRGEAPDLPLHPFRPERFDEVTT
ncbi:NAD(P)/FAD-dependent oxidoreductase [Dactylosporangium sp. NPDC048998]|uniref:NAD(P)/FAD-dependent oxidoreductase n=1 Tax=Dactylosporangium sp. NPDC048998 TaxID=3363976 RepID=UPI0037185571